MPQSTALRERERESKHNNHTLILSTYPSHFLLILSILKDSHSFLNNHKIPFLTHSKICRSAVSVITFTYIFSSIVHISG